MVVGRGSVCVYMPWAPNANGAVVGRGGEHGRVDGIPGDAIDRFRVTHKLGERFFASYVPDVNLKHSKTKYCF